MEEKKKKNKKKKKSSANLATKIMAYFMLVLMVLSVLAGIFAYV